METVVISLPLLLLQDSFLQGEEMPDETWKRTGSEGSTASLDGRTPVEAQGAACRGADSISNFSIPPAFNVQLHAWPMGRSG